MPNGGQYGQDYPKETDEDVILRVLRQRDEYQRQLSESHAETRKLKLQIRDLETALHLLKK